LSYWNRTGSEVARVHAVDADRLPDLVQLFKDEVVRDLAEAWDVTDSEGVVFSLRRYEGADHPSFDVVVDDDRVVGTFFVEGGLLHEHVLVRDDASAPVAEMETRDRVHEVRERHGERLAACRRTVEGLGNDRSDEVWTVEVEPHEGVLDRRVLVAAPLVCHLIGNPMRHFDPDSELALVLLVAVPPVGGVMLVVERAMDGLYWLRRKLN